MSNESELSERSERSERPMTRAEFCAAENISRSTYFKLKREGRGPAEEHFKNMALVRITAEARREWHKQNEIWSRSKAAKLEDQRRTALAKAAGELAAMSPRHVSKRNKIAKPARRSAKR